jgi:hypothetical protein
VGGGYVGGYVGGKSAKKVKNFHMVPWTKYLKKIKKIFFSESPLEIL